MARCYLVRHGHTALNSEDRNSDRIRGWRDVPLDKEGHKQAEELADYLADAGIREIFSSDLSRAKDTADALGDKIGVSVQSDEALRPWHLGHYQGESSARCWPEIKAYIEDKPDERVPDGESFNEFKDRFLGSLREMLEKVLAGETVACFSHYRTLKLTEAWLEADRDGLDYDVFFDDNIEPGAILVIEPDGDKWDWYYDEPLKKEASWHISADADADNSRKKEEFVGVGESPENPAWWKWSWNPDNNEFEVWGVDKDGNPHHPASSKDECVQGHIYPDGTIYTHLRRPTDDTHKQRYRLADEVKPMLEEWIKANLDKEPKYDQTRKQGSWKTAEEVFDDPVEQKIYNAGYEYGANEGQRAANSLRNSPEQAREAWRRLKDPSLGDYPVWEMIEEYPLSGEWAGGPNINDYLSEQDLDSVDPDDELQYIADLSNVWEDGYYAGAISGFEQSLASFLGKMDEPGETYLPSGWTAKVASGEIMYHISPAVNRESILQFGLVPKYGTEESVVWLTSDPDITPESREPGDDLWAVDVTDVPLDGDTISPNLWFKCTEIIPPDRLRLVSKGHTAKVAVRQMYHVAPTVLREQIATEGLKAQPVSDRWGPAVKTQPIGIYVFSNPVEARRYRDTYGGDIWVTNGEGAQPDPGGNYSGSYYLPTDRPAELYARDEDLEGKCWQCGTNSKGISGSGNSLSICNDCLGWHPKESKADPPDWKSKYDYRKAKKGENSCASCAAWKAGANAEGNGRGRCRMFDDEALANYTCSEWTSHWNKESNWLRVAEEDEDWVPIQGQGEVIRGKPLDESGNLFQYVPEPQDYSVDEALTDLRDGGYRWQISPSEQPNMWRLQHKREPIFHDLSNRDLQLKGYNVYYQDPWLPVEKPMMPSYFLYDTMSEKSPERIWATQRADVEGWQSPTPGALNEPWLREKHPDLWRKYRGDDKINENVKETHSQEDLGPSEVQAGRPEAQERLSQVERYVTATADDYVWPKWDDIHDISLDAVENHQGYRDPGLILGAVGNTQLQQQYGQHADIFDTAANLIAKIQRQQAVVEGNKRTATAVGLAFLENNGFDTTACTATEQLEDQLVWLVYNISDEGRDAAIGELADFLRQHCKPIRLAALIYQVPFETYAKFVLQSSWAEIQAKAKRLILEGKVTILVNTPSAIVAHVIGDGTDNNDTPDEHEVEIARDDPNSNVITQSTCDCKWNQFRFERTRKWKKFEGRVCSHILATYWKSKSTPIDITDMEPGVEYKAPIGQKGPQALPGQLSIPVPQPTPMTHEPLVQEPATPAPTAPPLPSKQDLIGQQPQNPFTRPKQPKPRVPQREQMQLFDLSPPPAGGPPAGGFSQPGQTPPDPTAGPLIPGTFSKWYTKEAMAMTPEMWQRVLIRTPYFYHVSDIHHKDAILREGIKHTGEATGIPGRMGIIYLFPHEEDALSGEEFLGLTNAVIFKIDASQLNPDLIEADEDYVASDPRGIVEQFGGIDPNDYYRDSDDDPNIGPFTQYWTPDQVAADVGSGWSHDYDKLADPDVSWGSYSENRTIAYAGDVPVSALMGYELASDARERGVEEWNWRDRGFNTGDIGGWHQGRKEAMAERSGDPELDVLIEQFQQSGETEWHGDNGIEYLRNPLEAEGTCSDISKLFAEWLNARGIAAFDAGEEAMFSDVWGLQDYLDRHPDRADNPMLHSDFTPNAWGYNDATRQSEYPEHSATVVQLPSGTYMVDWTAAQYGYSEFPMVQKLDQGGWQREWTSAWRRETMNGDPDAPYEHSWTEAEKQRVQDQLAQHSEWYEPGMPVTPKIDIDYQKMVRNLYERLLRNDPRDPINKSPENRQSWLEALEYYLFRQNPPGFTEDLTAEAQNLADLKATYRQDFGGPYKYE